MNSQFKIFFFVLFVLSITLCSCKSIQSSETFLLNDDDMSFDHRWAETYDEDYYRYREGSSGAWGSSSGGGGCGCN